MHFIKPLWFKMYDEMAYTTSCYAFVTLIWFFWELDTLVFTPRSDKMIQPRPRNSINPKVIKVDKPDLDSSSEFRISLDGILNDFYFVGGKRLISSYFKHSRYERLTQYGPWRSGAWLVQEDLTTVGGI